MSVISLGGMSELPLLGWWKGLRPHYTLKLNASERLIVGWKLESVNIDKGRARDKEGDGF
jgi:hypothetical protein